MLQIITWSNKEMYKNVLYKYSKQNNIRYVYLTDLKFHKKIQISQQVEQPQRQDNEQQPQKQSKKFKKIGNYIIREQIGQGSFSEVRLGQHILTGEQVAIKIIDKNKITDKDDVLRLQRELSIMKLVSHKNIVKLYELIDTQKHLYIIQEFIQGGELFNYVVQQKRLKEQQASRFMCQILQALHYLHCRSISHRDLKLENILLTNKKDPTQIKLIDFGLSITQTVDCKSSCGSPAYSCIQIWQNKEYDGAKCDIWSAGICLYAMLCGCLPFQGKDSHTLYANILKHQIHYPSYISQEARNMINMMLQVQEKQRGTIPELLQMPFITKYNTEEERYINPNEQIVHQQNNLPLLDMYSLYIMKTNNFDINKTIIELKQNKHNSLTATYCLLSSQLEKQKDNQNESLQKLLKIIKLKPIKFAQDYLKLKLNSQNQVIINDEVVAEILQSNEKLISQLQEMSSGQIIQEVRPQVQNMFAPQEAMTETSNKQSQTNETEQQYRKYYAYINSENQFSFKASVLDQKLNDILKNKDVQIEKEAPGRYTILFKQQNVIINIQVCRVGNTNTSSLLIKRMQGDNYIFKDIAEQLMSECKK